MKKIIKILVVLTLILSFTACSKQSKVNSIKSTEVVTENLDKKIDSKDKKLEVYTSFYPLYDFAVKVGGDKVHVTNLVPAGTEPHDWEPATTDILSLEKGDILIYNGVGMEHWIDQVTASLENESLILVEASKGLTLLERDAEEGENKNSEKTPSDPHVWLSIRNAKKEMETIKDAFVKADPDNAAYYEDNFNKNAADFEALDTKFKNELLPLTNKDIVVAHQAFAYLCADYGLNQIAIEGFAADSEPDAKRMAEIIDLARSKKIKTIFFEELVSPKVAEAIASEIGAKTDVLNPLEGLTQEQINAGEDYLSIMNKNLKVLVSALK